MAYHPEWLKGYYHTKIWQERWKQYAKRHRRRCAAYGQVKKPIHLQHLEYSGPWGDLRNPADWGKEPDQTLVWLCDPRWLGFIRGCHFNAHGAEASGRFRDLSEVTDEIVRRGRRRQAIQKRLGV
jgi:hypothetical protein